MIISHNLNAMNAHRNISSLTVSQGKSIEKLNSGLRINRACDDSAGLAISERMRSQIRGLNQASKNTQDGISMVQTAEGALIESQAIGQRMRELAVQAANGTYTDDDRAIINQEFEQLKSEMDRISVDTEFNGRKLLDGSISGKVVKFDAFANPGGGATGNLVQKIDTKPEELAKLGQGTFEYRVDVKNAGTNATVIVDLVDTTLDINGGKEYLMGSVELRNVPTNQRGVSKEVIIAGIKMELDLNGLSTSVAKFENKADKIGDGVKLQVGANQNQITGFSVDNMRVRELRLRNVDVLTAQNAQDAIQSVDTAISKMSQQRSNLGAIQNRLEHTLASTNNTAENLQASESRIRDVDMAKEMMNLTKLNVLQQASQSMLAQANQAPQNVLSILK